LAGMHGNADAVVVGFVGVGGEVIDSAQSVESSSQTMRKTDADASTWTKTKTTASVGPAALAGSLECHIADTVVTGPDFVHETAGAVGAGSKNAAAPDNADATASQHRRPEEGTGPSSPGTPATSLMVSAAVRKRKVQAPVRVHVRVPAARSATLSSSSSSASPFLALQTQHSQVRASTALAGARRHRLPPRRPVPSSTMVCCRSSAMCWAMPPPLQPQSAQCVGTVAAVPVSQIDH
jgi:hypothetical protein